MTRLLGMSFSVCLVAAPACTTTLDVGNPGLPDAVPPPAPDAAVGCDARRPCPAPSAPDRFSICGHVHTLEETTPVDSLAGTVFVELLDVVAAVDSCGRYDFIDLPLPDPDGATLVLSAGGLGFHGTRTTVHVNPAALYDELPLFALRETTIDVWSAALPGVDLRAHGAAVTIHVAGASVDPLPGSPLPGVVVDSAVYFSDVDPLRRLTVDPTLLSTGPNGTSLVAGTAAAPRPGIEVAIQRVE